MREMINILPILLIVAASMLYSLNKILAFKQSENRKKREHLKKMGEMRYKDALDRKKSDNLPNIDENAIAGILDKYGINSDEDIEEAIETYGLPSWLLPIAKGFLSKAVDKKDDEIGKGF